LAAVDLWIGQLMDRFINYNRDESLPLLGSIIETTFKKDRARYMGVWTLLITLGVPVGPFIFGFLWIGQLMDRFINYNRDESLPLLGSSRSSGSQRGSS
jgi:hypothetical protein